MHHAENGSYPPAEPADSTNPPAGLVPGTGNTFQYTTTGPAYCLTATSSRSSDGAFNISNLGSIVAGTCPGHTGGGGGGGGSGVIADGALMQTITSANCPDERTRAIDARDSRTYWVQEMPDGKCWMLTNLAYAGGGTNAHGDVKILQNGTGDTARTYTEAKYYIPSGANVTAGSTNPSASTDGTGQYGYLYNYCAAAGVQVDTAACLSETTPVLSEDVSICPAGWRLPTGEAGGMFQALNNAVNQGRTNTDQGLREAWLAQSAGSWNPDFCNQGVLANYWSSFQQSGSGLARYMTFYSTGITPVANNLKSFGFSVRCVAV